MTGYYNAFSMPDKTQSRNPYHRAGQQPMFLPSVCAYIDVLGYKEMWCRAERDGKEDTFLQELYEALEEGQEWLWPNDSDWPTDKDRYAIKAFTDNIVIGWPVKSDAESELGSIFSSLAYFQLRMVSKGFFIRGAISVGRAYVDDVVVLGSAFLEAYRGESQAVNPRIILSDSATSAVRKHLTYYSRPDHAPQYSDLYQDPDGKWFVNYLETILAAGEECPFLEEVEIHKDNIVRRLEEFRSESRIREKYIWVANYHNFFCDQRPHHFTDYKIDLTILQPSFCRIAQDAP
jgi:hypothetical protein